VRLVLHVQDVPGDPAEEVVEQVQLCARLSEPICRAPACRPAVRAAARPRRPPAPKIDRAVCPHHSLRAAPPRRARAGKVCSAKQSIRKVFAKSERAADIRGVVQGLNMKGGEARAAAAEAAEPSPTNSPHDDRAQVVPKERSAWGAFVSQAPPSDDEAEADDDAGDDGGETTTQWEQSVSAKRQSRKVHPTAAAGPASQQPRPRSPARPPA
jgi:hypothetical protein